jgi:hypothetical protein
MIAKQQPAWFLVLSMTLIALTACVTDAQVTFSSGSLGEDGDLTFYTPPVRRIDHAMVYDAARQQVVLFGGERLSGDGGKSAETWLWDGTVWTQVNSPNQPEPRDEHSMVYDSTRQRVVLFGGHGLVTNDELNDTWEWDGTQWTKIDTAVSPPVIQACGLAFDSTRNVVVMFGGTDGGTESDDTWEYNGSTWTQITPVASPSARTDMAMAYDVARQLVIMHGGSTTGHNSAAVNETWSYDGGTWAQLSPGTTPGASAVPREDRRMAHGLAYNPDRQTLMLFGGVTSTSVQANDVWEWNGTDWAEIVAAAATPDRRSEAPIAYDAARQRLLMFGGFTDAVAGDTWLLDPATATWTAPLTVQANPVIDMAARSDGIWRYGNVTVPSGVTLTFLPNAANTPVTWLVQGTATIDGEINLDGKTGASLATPGSEAAAGPGGFAGGIGGIDIDTGTTPGTPGIGPGGGNPGVSSGTSAGYGGFSTVGINGNGGTGGAIYSNPAIVPMVGGSGGGGGASSTANGGGGGGGGGAILIAADTIRVTGTISSDGGARNTSGGDGGIGSGGAIKLVANSISGSGAVEARDRGRIRFEGFSVMITGTVTPTPSVGFPQSLDYAAYLATLPSVQVASVTHTSGTTVSVPSVGNPDVTFADAGAVTVNLTSTNVPAGTTFTVRVTVVGQALTATSTAAAGDGTASAAITVPAGTGTIQAFADYLVP